MLKPWNVTENLQHYNIKFEFGNVYLRTHKQKWFKNLYVLSNADTTEWAVTNKFCTNIPGHTIIPASTFSQILLILQIFTLSFQITIT
jgi:hypothetical protein